MATNDSLQQHGQRGVLQASFGDDDDGLGLASFAGASGQIRGVLNVQKVF